MNLLGRRRSGLVLLLALIFWRCEDPLDISLEEDRNTDKFGVFYREIQIPTSIVYVDSLVTSNQALLLAGYYQDDNFGKLDVTGYSELLLGNRGRTYDSAFYDSLVLELPVDYQLGLFPSLNKLHIYQLADTLKSRLNFNVTTVPLEPEPIASTTFNYDPEIDSTVHIRLDDQLGMELFDKAVNGDTIFSSQVLFRRYFRGLGIKGDPDNSAVFGFNANESRMVMHYHEIDENGEVDTLTYDFVMQQATKFHNVSNDRTGTALEGLTEPHTEFVTNDGFSYLHEGIGLVLKLDFNKAIQQLKDTVDQIVVNRADLQIGVLQPFTDYLAPPQSYRLAFASEENRLISISTQGEPWHVQRDYSNPFGNENKVEIFLDTDDRLYRTDHNNAITGFTQSLLNESLENGKVLLYPLTMNERLGRMVVDSRFIQLKLYFTIPK